MKKVYDFTKAVEQKQKRMETKKKHKPAKLLIEEQVKEIVEASGVLEDINKELSEFSGEYLQRYNQLAESYLNLGSDYKKLAELLNKVIKTSDKYSYFSSLAEHFIVKNDLEEEFIQFIKDVAENETVKEYREAAEWKDGFYRMEIEGVGMYEMIDDEYGWLKEEQEEAN